MKHDGEDIDREGPMSDRCTQLRLALETPLCRAFAVVTTPLFDVISLSRTESFSVLST